MLLVLLRVISLRSSRRGAPQTVAGDAWSSCRLVPHRTGQVAFPTSGSSAPIQGRHAPIRFQLVHDPQRWPPDPGESVIESLPVVAPLLALSVQPFIWSRVN